MFRRLIGGNAVAAERNADLFRGGIADHGQSARTATGGCGIETDIQGQSLTRGERGARTGADQAETFSGDRN